MGSSARRAISHVRGNDIKEPFCGCKHHFSMHNKNGACMDKVRRVISSVPFWDPCPCVRYTGPVPVTELWVPPVSSELEQGK